MFSFSTRFFTTQYNIYHYCIWPAHKSKSEFLRFDNDGRHSVYSRCRSTRKKCGDVAMLYILPEIHKSKLSKYYSNCRIIFFPVDTFHCNIGRTSFFGKRKQMSKSWECVSFVGNRLANKVVWCGFLTACSNGWYIPPCSWVKRTKTINDMNDATHTHTYTLLIRILLWYESNHSLL